MNPTVWKKSSVWRRTDFRVHWAQYFSFSWLLSLKLPAQGGVTVDDSSVHNSSLKCRLSLCEIDLKSHLCNKRSCPPAGRRKLFRALVVSFYCSYAVRKFVRHQTDQKQNVFLCFKKNLTFSNEINASIITCLDGRAKRIWLLWSALTRKIRTTSDVK